MSEGRGRIDILVVGAGAAGLAAAQKLEEAGREVLVIEARDRLGGRIDTRREPGWPVPLELGAELVHGTSPVLRAALRRRRAQVAELEGAHWCRGARSLAPCGEAYERIGEILAAPGPDEPMWARFDRLRRSRTFDAAALRLAERFVEGFYAAPLDRAGAAAIAAMEEAEGRIEGQRTFRVPAGYDQVLPRASRVRFGAVVRELRCTRGSVEARLETATGLALPSMKAELAIAAVPIGVLRSRRMILHPWPRERATALRKIEMGPILKVFLRFRSPLWPREASLMHGQRASLAFPTWWPVPSSAVLVGWSAGRAAAALRGSTGRVLLGRALASLAHLLSTRARALEAELEGWRAVDWESDPFAGGGYAWFGVGGLEAQRLLAEPLERRIYFAGEALNLEGHAGTVHGALESGERVSEEILARGSFGRRRSSRAKYLTPQPPPRQRGGGEGGEVGSRGEAGGLRQPSAG